MTLFPDDYIETIPLREMQEKADFWMSNTSEHYFWKKWNVTDKIKERTKDIQEALDKHIWNKIEEMKTEFWYLLFALCNSANEKWIDLAEAFETANEEIDDMLGDNEDDDKPHLDDENENLIWFEIELGKK